MQTTYTEGKLNKRLEVEEGIDVLIIPTLIRAFIKSVNAGDSGEHMGRRNGIVFGMTDDTYYYVCQTEQTFIIRKG